MGLDLLVRIYVESCYIFQTISFVLTIFHQVQFQILQNLKINQNIFVSLNPFLEPNESMYKKKLVYDHPVFDRNMIDAREKLLKIQGQDHIWHSGAWTGNGFHEDGFVSGKKVATAINDKTN